MKLITTSWDDGHPADFKIAELLDKYNLPGTFYIPQTNREHEVMSESKILELAQKFEIGGHTMNHIRINKASNKLFDTEIKGCYKWLSDLLGHPPLSFCFPGGIYNYEAVKYTSNIGFKTIRTTELLNPWLNNKTQVQPTTLQVYPHSAFTYYKHLLKRGKLKSLLLYSKTGNETTLDQLTQYYINYVQQNGGCFHLWGHSWEIEEYNLWQPLENIFKAISNIADMKYVYNKNLPSHNNELN